MKRARAKTKKSIINKRSEREPREVRGSEPAKVRRTSDPYAPKAYESAQQKRKAADPYMPKAESSAKAKTTKEPRGVSAIQKRRQAKQKKKLLWAKITTAAWSWYRNVCCNFP